MSKIHELAFNAEEIDELLDSVDKKTIYQDATQSEHGLMSATDKIKLDALPTAQQINGALDAKVDKVAGKGLSKNDYTDADKESVASAYHKPQSGIPKTDLASDVQTSLGKADTAIQEHQDISGKADKSDTYTKSEVDAKVTSVMRYKGSVNNYAALSAIQNPSVGDVYNVLDTGHNYAYDGTSWDALSGIVSVDGKADKVSNATNGNFAGLDANGNLTDSGSKASDFATSSQGAKADTAYQKPQAGIPESDLSSDLQSQLNKHFKGWLESTEDLPANPVVGDYAYVEDNGTSYIYRCTTDGEWPSTSTEEKDPVDATFADGQEVNEVHLINDCTTGGVNDVLSAEQGKVLNLLRSSIENHDLDIIDESGNCLVRFNDGNIETKNFNSNIATLTTEADNYEIGDFSIIDSDKNILVKFKNGGIETKNFNSSKVLISNKKPYTPNWERFTVTINRTPVGKAYRDSSKKTDNGESNESIKTVTCVIALPETYTPTGTPTKLICFCHGTSGNVTDTQWYNNNQLMIEHFVPYWLSKGYAIFDCNGVADGMDRYYETNSAPCGLPDTMQAYMNCYNYIIENYNVYPRIYLWGCSDGGPVPLNWQYINPSSIAAIAICDGIVDLYQDSWNGSFGHINERRASIAERLGFDDLTGATYEHDKADIWNPFSRIKEINNEKYIFGFNAPIFIASTASGSYFSASTFHVREEYAQALINGGSICLSKWYDTFTHNDVAMGGSDVVLNDVFKWYERFK